MICPGSVEVEGFCDSCNVITCCAGSRLFWYLLYTGKNCSAYNPATSAHRRRDDVRLLNTVAIPDVDSAMTCDVASERPVRTVFVPFPVPVTISVMPWAMAPNNCDPPSAAAEMVVATAMVIPVNKFPPPSSALSCNSPR